MPPPFLFRKRRQSEAAAISKPPQSFNMNVDAEPLPHMPSKFRTLLDGRRGRLFSRSTADMRRAAGLSSRQSLLQGDQPAVTQRATIKIVPDVPSLEHAANGQRPPRPSSTQAENKEESVDGHSDGDNGNSVDISIPSANGIPRPPQRAELSIMNPQQSVGAATTAPNDGSTSLPPLALRRAAAPVSPLIDVSSPADGPEQLATMTSSPATVSPSSTAFMTPPQRISEDATLPTISTSAIDVQHRRSYDTSHTVRPIPERRASTMSNLSTDGRKLHHVLLSPPMPQPIARLPTLTTPAAPASPTHVWGELALMGGPKSPTAGPSNTPFRNPGPSSFPFPPASHLPSHAADDLTDADLKSVTKAMPVMARVQSTTADEPTDDGGDAGDDDSCVDSEEQSNSSFSELPEPDSPTRGKGKGVLRRSGLLESPSSPLSQSPSGPDLVAENDGDDHGPAASSSYPLDRPQPATSVASTGGDDDWENDNDNDSDLPSEPATPSTATTNTVVVTPLTPAQALQPPPLFSHASKSMVNLSSPVQSSRPFLETVTEVHSPFRSPVIESAATLASPPAPPLKRRLSAGEAGALPPKYDAESAAGFFDGSAPRPREEEGRERLPPYWCGVHIEGTLSRKMEFLQPGIQAKDRAWKKFYFVLHGTALFVYKFDPAKVPLRANEPYLTCDDSDVGRFLHVHPAPDRRFLNGMNISPAPTPPRQQATRAEKQARRNTISLEAALRGTPIGAIQHTIATRRSTVGSQTPTNCEGSAAPASRDYKDPELFSDRAARRQPLASQAVASSTASAPLASHMPFAHNILLHEYTLQGAESGLAADYKKRQHCVRIRAEGQQFMLQTETARQCVQWIEAFQAATNVALDLEVRPMPIQQTLPRRRRRPGARRAAAATATPADPNAAPTSDNANAAFEDTPEGNIAAVEAAERAAREAAARERDRMLGEDQAANQGAFST